jgi:hypothetical protein
MVIDHSQDWFFSDWWLVLFSLEWSVHFMVRGVWFPSHLPLEGIDHIQNFVP